MMRTLLAALLVVAVQQPATWRAVDLRAKDTDIDGRSCSWDAPVGSVFRRASDGRVEVNCDAASAAAVLHCDPAGFEPRDVLALSLCASPAIDFDTGHATTIVPNAAADVRVTWLRALEAPQLEARADRTIAAQDRFSIPVADQSFVRFAPTGASPRTVSAATLADRPWTLRVDTGGEIFARAEASRIAPQTLEVAMVGRSPLSFRSAWFSLPAQAPGQYMVTRVYPGGVRTAPMPVSVRAARTTDVWLPAENVGGVHVTADLSVCLSDSVFELVPIAGLSDKPIVSTSTRASCRWTIGGLAPGQYRARVIAEPMSGVPAEADVTVTAQEWSDVELSPPPVVVRGQILILGRPAAKRDVQFVGDQPPASVVVPDDDGRYVVGLKTAGTYGVSLDASPLGYRTYEREFTFGENRYDLDIRGALLRIRITQSGERPKGPVSLTIRGPRAIQRVITTFDRPVELDGLPYGVYVVSATASGGLQSLDYAVTLSEKIPSALVWVDVSRERRVLRVQTETGMPVPQATMIVSGGGSQSLQVPTGIFPLPPLAVRTPIFVLAPDFSPTCIIVTGANEERATMIARIASVELRFPRPAPGQPAVINGDLYGIPWASCPLPIERAGGQIVQRPGYDAVILKLPIGQMQIDRQGVRTVFDVPGFPVTVK